MDLTCPTCAATTVVPDDRLPPEGARARCQTCSGMSVYYRGGLVADDPTPPQGIDAALTQQLPAEAYAQALAALPSIALARPLPKETDPPPPPAPALAGPERSIGWQIRTVAGDRGPLPQDALKPLIRDGRLKADDLACPPGATEWTRAGDLPDLQRWFTLQKKTGVAAASAPGEAVASCVRHPGVRGRWMCQGCGDLSCDTCVISAEVMRVHVKQCPLCRKACTELVPTRKIKPFWEEIPSLLKYPFQGLGWIALIIFPLLGIGVMLSRAAAMAMAMAWGAAGFLALIIYAYHMYVIRVTTRGERSLPNLTKVDNYEDELFKPTGKAFLVSLLLFWPTLWATNAVKGSRFELGLATGYHEGLMRDKAAFEERQANPSAAAAPEEPVFDEDSIQGALDSAFADPEEFGSVMGQMFSGAYGDSEDRDWDSELRQAKADVAEAKSQVRVRELIRGVLVVSALFIWPIFLIIIALFNTIVPVFQPQILIKLIQEIPREYAWCTAITSVCFLAIYLLNLPMRGILVFESWLTSPATYYFSLIAFHVMGRTAELAEQKVDWH